MDNLSVLDVASPAEIQNLVVKGSIEVGATIDVESIDSLSVAGDLDISLTLPGLPGAPATALALGSGEIGGTLPEGVGLTAESIGQLDVDGPMAGDITVEPVAGSANTIVNNLGELDAGSIPYTGTVTVAGNLGTLDVGRGFTDVGHDMAGLIDVTGTLGTARIGGGTPGEFIAGHVGTIGAYGGFGPVVLNVIEAGVQRRLEADPTGVIFSQASPFDTAGSPYINIQYLYESAGFSSPQISARITNAVGTAADQFDLSTVVFQDGGKFNLDRLDAAGVAGIRNVAVEGDLVNTLSATAANFFRLPNGSPDPSPAGVYLPMDDLASVSVRDDVPDGSIDAAEIQAVAFGSFTNTQGQVVPGSQATNADAARLLAPGTKIVQAGSVNGQATETFRVPFAALPGQQVAFFLDTASGGGRVRPQEHDLHPRERQRRRRRPDALPGHSRGRDRHDRCGPDAAGLGGRRPSTSTATAGRSGRSSLSPSRSPAPDRSET